MKQVKNYFSIQELVPKSEYNKLKKAELLHYGFRYIDDRALYTANQLREKFGVAYINTWWMSDLKQKYYGNNNYRGWRPIDCEIGAKMSGHKFGEAIDEVFERYNAETVREYILKNESEFPYIIELETDISWVHFRVGIRSNNIKTFRP